MKNFSFTNITIFILFFGVAAIEAFQSKNWLKVVFWIGIGLLFLLGDLIRNKAEKSKDSPER